MKWSHNKYKVCTQLTIIRLEAESPYKADIYVPSHTHTLTSATHLKLLRIMKKFAFQFVFSKVECKVYVYAEIKRQEINFLL